MTEVSSIMAKICNINFWIENDPPPPPLELFRKFIRFGRERRPLRSGLRGLTPPPPLTYGQPDRKKTVLFYDDERVNPPTPGLLSILAPRKVKSGSKKAIEGF